MQVEDKGSARQGSDSMADAEQSAASTEQQERKEEQPAAEESSAATGSNKPLPSGVAEDEEAALPEVPMSEVDLEQDGPAAAENGKNGHSDQVAPASVPSQPRSSISSASSPPPSIPSSARLTRSDTIASSRTSTGSIAASRKPLLQGVLVITSFETILNSKDAKRIPPLKAAAQKALDLLRAPNAVSPDEDKREEVFEPLRLACETRTNALMITALDTIGKLVSYGFFNPPTTAEEQGSEDVSGDSSRFDGADSMVRDEKSERLSDAVVDTICNCFVDIPSGPVAAATSSVTGASGADAVNLQIVKALLTLVLQDAGGKGLSVHQSSLVSCNIISIANLADAYSAIFPAQSRTNCLQYLSTFKISYEPDGGSRCSQSDRRKRLYPCQARYETCYAASFVRHGVTKTAQQPRKQQLQSTRTDRGRSGYRSRS